jgi:hypothetical protein
MKTVNYYVSVVRVDGNNEEEVFSMDFEHNADDDTRDCVINALKTSYRGCSDKD